MKLELETSMSITPSLPSFLILWCHDFDKHDGDDGDGDDDDDDDDDDGDDDEDTPSLMPW